MTDSTVLPEIDINQIATDLNGKADKDLTNAEPSQTFKTSVIHLMMPDYSAGVSKSWNTSIKADKDGWVYVNGQSASASNESSFRLAISTNNSTWVTVSSLYTATTYGSGAVMVPIPKGIYYKAEAGSNTRTLTFYPCIGA